VYFIEGYLARNIFRETATEHEIQNILRDYAAQHHLSSPPFGQMHLFNFVLVCILISGFSIGLRVSEKFIQQEKHQKELEKVRLSAELAFLKNQISPHFFFNTLNNIYSLIGVNSEDAQEAVLKLSKLMRYLLYESDQEKVRLDQEIEFMNNYIDLMKLRLSNKVDLQVSFPEKSNGIMIPPLIFIPFIENAFKYGISYKEKSFVHLSLSVKDQDLLFMCSNSMVGTKDKGENQFSGIGLENVSKRLNLLFPKHHSLNLTESDSVYNVQLTINSPEQK
jgi:LytS/YehU family sensor histidine kinase